MPKHAFRLRPPASLAYSAKRLQSEQDEEITRTAPAYTGLDAAVAREGRHAAL